MLLSLNWLREMVPYEGSARELGSRLTMLGLELEEIRCPFAHLDKVVVGHILTCMPHPDAHKLSVTTVDVGSGDPLPVVCGAPNVAQGQTVPVALAGAELTPGHKIKKSKLRGQPSHAMICAEQELGLGQEQGGIMVLDSGLIPGTPLADALHLDQLVLDIGVTPNRSDCMSVLGLARETALAFDLPLTLPTVNLTEIQEPASSRLQISIEEGAPCQIFQGRVLEGVTMGPSPAWLRYRLIALGQRPVNAVVDVTNYVMFELGQPQHAYDAHCVAGRQLRAGMAQQAMTLTTLDGQKRTLLPTDQLIYDREKPVGLAGVMGGENTEITESTTEIFLESAVFTPAVVRKTARRLALPSEASYRFERGVDHPGSAFANDRAAALIAEFTGAQVLSGQVVAQSTPYKERVVPFSLSRSNALLGIETDTAFCEKTLSALGCTPDTNNAETWQVRIPSHRNDLEREVDLIEEIARVYGMDRIPAVLPAIGKSLDNACCAETDFAFMMRLKHWARGAGLREAINYSFMAAEDLDNLALSSNRRVAVKNPLSADQNVMRPAVFPGLLHTLRVNTSHGTTRLRLFEYAHIFQTDPASKTGVTEPHRLALLLHGRRSPARWPWPENHLADYSDIKGLTEHLLHFLGLPQAQYLLEKEHPYFSPCVTLMLGENRLGEAGQLRPELAQHYEARSPVWIAELDADLLREQAQARSVRFTPLPTFPSVRRDITVIAPRTLSVAAILDTINAMHIDFLEECRVVDNFEPENTTTRNITLRLTYQHPERTLRDKEVDKRHTRVRETIISRLPVEI